MDGKQIPAVDPARRGSDKTAIRITAAVADPEARRGPLGRCVDWFLRWTFILTWLVVAKFSKPWQLHDESQEDSGNSGRFN